MSDPNALADTLAIDAWTGSMAPSSGLHSDWRTWAVQRNQVDAKQPLASEEIDLRDWGHPEVGWGLVLPENETIGIRERATGADAPAPLRELLEKRKGPVLRYRADILKLRRYYSDGSSQDMDLGQSKPGIAKGRLPKYLLIAASPKQVPWRFQYLLNTCAFVGRLDLGGTQLENYVNALLNNWSDAKCQIEQPVVWAVDHGSDDITFLMRHSIAEPVRDALSKDSAILDKVRHFAAATATRENLANALAEATRKPALIVTTSHGMTGPKEDAQLMAQTLGCLVDGNRSLVSPGWLLERWQPDGAIWYAHACCSAGSDSRTSFTGLVQDDIERTLLDVAALGAQVAPLPTALLGAPRPLRAFVGHVEPTFNWTLRDPNSKQLLTGSICEALYKNMHRARPEPVGMAFESCFKHVGQLLQQWIEQVDKISNEVSSAKREAARQAALRLKLTGLDRQSFVILGDPTVALPPFAPM